MSRISYRPLTIKERQTYQELVTTLEAVQRGERTLPDELSKHAMASDAEYVKHALGVFRNRLAKGNPTVHLTIEEALD